MTGDPPSDAANSRAAQGRMLRLRSGQGPEGVYPSTVGAPEASIPQGRHPSGDADGGAVQGDRSEMRAQEADQTLLWYVGIGAACASLISFLSYSHRGDILLFGDAVAHINIARRVFD